jgi:hypothetical protein
MTPLVIRSSRWGYLPLAAAALFMGSFFVAYLFFWEHLPEEAPDAVATTVFAALSLACAFLAVHWVRALVVNPAMLELDDQGFTYCPAGVSTGLIAWRDVMELRDITVTVGGSGYGPEPTPVLAVVLHDPEAYRARFPALLRPLLQARQGLSGTSLVIDLNHLGPRRAEVRAAMEAHISRSQG